MTPQDNPNIGSTVVKWLPISGLDFNLPTWEEEKYSYPGQTLREALISTLHLCHMLDFPDEQDHAEAQGDLKILAQNRRDRRELCKGRIVGYACGEKWVFFRSPKGFMGLADRRARHTDCIAVALGASVPCILRKEGGHYRLIGEAYVHGIMEGETIQMMSRGELGAEMIDIL